MANWIQRFLTAIATHKGDATAHQDAPALIATHGEGAKHRWTSGKIRVGAGAGTNPTEIDVPGGIASGLIVMWHGTIANIPAGYVICDGNNSTPNLLTRFIEGVADAITDPGATGGATAKTSETHKHSMPSHNHTATVGGGYGASLEQTPSTPGGGCYWQSSRAKVSPQTISSKDPGDTHNATVSITDIRPLFYDIAFLMKT